MANQPVLNNVRVCFQRLNDAKFVNGWIRRITPESVVVHAFTDARLEIGNEFAFHAFGGGKDAFFRATATRVQRADPSLILFRGRMPGFSVEMECDIQGQMSFKDSRSQPRFFVTGFTASVRDSNSDAATEAAVIDIGVNGFSFFTETPLRKGDSIEVEISGRGQTMNLGVEVRNCVGCGPDAQLHRVGTLITKVSRLDGHKWQQTYNAILEESRMPCPSKGARPQVIQPRTIAS